MATVNEVHTPDQLAGQLQAQRIRAERLAELHGDARQWNQDLWALGDRLDSYHADEMSEADNGALDGALMALDLLSAMTRPGWMDAHKCKPFGDSRAYEQLRKAGAHMRRLDARNAFEDEAIAMADKVDEG